LNANKYGRLEQHAMKMRMNIACQGIVFVDAHIDWLSAYRSRQASCHAFRTGESRHSITVRVPSRISALVCIPAQAKGVTHFSFSWSRFHASLRVQNPKSSCPAIGTTSFCGFPSGRLRLPELNRIPAVAHTNSAKQLLALRWWQRFGDLSSHHASLLFPSKSSP